MNILIVLDQLPYPPRNGITLPLYEYITRLKSSNNLKLLLLLDDESVIDSTQLGQNEERFGPIAIVRLVRKNQLSRLLEEISLREMYQHGWRFIAEEVPFRLENFPVTVVSPMSTVAKWRALTSRSRISKSGNCVALINDCTAAEYRYRWKSISPGLAMTLKAGIDYFRSFLVARIEKKLLTNYQSIVVQTDTDRQAVTELVSTDLAQSIHVIPNGVNESLLEIYRNPNNRILLVAELSGEYSDITKWLLKDVWPSINSARPDLWLHIVGKGADAELVSSMRTAKNVEHTVYAPILREVYSSALLAWCPVFKGFGLINKTIEAMAAGVPVIGGSAAFNGIKGFSPSVHGVICNRSAISFVNKTLELARDTESNNSIGNAGRELIKTQFSWERSMSSITRLLSKRN